MQIIARQHGLIMLTQIALCDGGEAVLRAIADAPISMGIKGQFHQRLIGNAARVLLITQNRRGLLALHAGNGFGVKTRGGDGKAQQFITNRAIAAEAAQGAGHLIAACRKG